MFYFHWEEMDIMGGEDKENDQHAKEGKKDILDELLHLSTPCLTINFMSKAVIFGPEEKCFKVAGEELVESF